MTDPDNLLIDILSSVFSNLCFIISLLLVILVAACFLGRYIFLTRKLILSTLSALVISIAGSLILSALFPSEEYNVDTAYLVNYAINGIMYVFAFFFYFFAYKEKRFLRAVESVICLYVFSLYISTFSQLTVLYLAGGTAEDFEKIFFDNLATGPYWLAIILLTFILTLALFLIVYFGFYRGKKYYVVGIPYRILFVIWTLMFIVIPFYPAAFPPELLSLDRRYHALSIMYAVGIITLGLIVPVFVLVFSAERTLQARNKYQESYLAAELEYMNQYKKQQTETRAFRHDIKNNLAITSMMLEKGDLDGARTHISDMLGNVSSLSPQFVTGDDMLDIIVSMKADRMEETGIAFTLDGVVDGGLKIRPMDMCSIFANALDNAIEAASSCKSPSISLNIRRTDRFFIIKITNSTSVKVDTDKLMASSGYTSKKDKEHHGFGLMNIRRSVEDYNGVLKAESTDDTFTLSIMMPRPE
ncbi:MAG: GHKL domain-containing protein [Clostridiales bacterium]|nr:GHKL domain-containing protein [Clostridiales bacterium]